MKLIRYVQQGRQTRLAPSVLALAALFSLFFPLRAHCEPIDGEKASKVMAAYVYNFTRFTEWPEARFTDSNSPIVIGVLGNEQFAGMVKATTKGKKAHGRSLSVRTLRHVPSSDTGSSPSEARRAMQEELLQCHLLFIDLSLMEQMEDVRSVVGGEDIVTVSDADRFAEKGGMIGFALENRRIVFEVNHREVNATNVRMSSKLLKLARIVTPKGE